MRCRLCGGFSAGPNFRTAGDNAIDVDDTIDDDNAIGAVTVGDHALFDDVHNDHIAPGISAPDDDIDDDRAGDNWARDDDRTGGSFAFDDTAAAGRPLGRSEGGHDRPFGVGVAPPARGQALRL
jgi:hypothetical protein